MGRPPPRHNIGYISWRTTIGLGICLLLTRPPLGSIGRPPLSSIGRPPPRYNMGYISWQRTIGLGVCLSLTRPPSAL